VTVAKDGRTITITPGSGRYLSTAQGVLTFDISGTSIE
jgi:hypothetical protein